MFKEPLSGISWPRLHSLDKTNSVASQRKDKTNVNLTEHDAVSWHVLRFRSWAARAINQPGKAATYFLGRHFVPYMRFMLMIPQLVRGADYAEGGRHNGDFQPCLMCRKGERLDPWATHAALCTGTSDANQALHDDMVMTLPLDPSDDSMAQGQARTLCTLPAAQLLHQGRVRPPLPRQWDG